MINERDKKNKELREISDEPVTLFDYVNTPRFIFFPETFWLSSSIQSCIDNYWIRYQHKQYVEISFSLFKQQSLVNQLEEKHP